MAFNPRLKIGQMIRLEELNQARKEIEKASGNKPVKQNQFRVI